MAAKSENIFVRAKAYQKLHPRTAWAECIQKVKGKRAVSGINKVKNVSKAEFDKLLAKARLHQNIRTWVDVKNGLHFEYNPNDNTTVLVRLKGKKSIAGIKPKRARVHSKPVGTSRVKRGVVAHSGIKKAVAIVKQIDKLESQAKEIKNTDLKHVYYRKINSLHAQLKKIN